MAILRVRLTVDYSICSINYELVTVFVGTKSGAEDIPRRCVECTQNINWGILLSTTTLMAGPW